MEAISAQTVTYIPMRVGPSGWVIVLSFVSPTLLTRNESVIVFEGG
jgi:hypothetical protein